MAEVNLSRRRDLALTEIDALAVNLIHDLRALDRKLIALAPAAAVAVCADLRLLESSVECIRAELVEARAGKAAGTAQTHAERAADMTAANRAERVGLLA